MLININNRVLINSEQIVKVEKTAKNGCLIYMSAHAPSPHNIVMLNETESKAAWTILLQLATKETATLKK